MRRLALVLFALAAAFGGLAWLTWAARAGLGAEAEVAGAVRLLVAVALGLSVWGAALLKRR